MEDLHRQGSNDAPAQNNFRIDVDNMNVLGGDG